MGQPLADAQQADERDEQAVNAAHIEILKRVIRQVREQKTPTNEAATQIVVRQYSERIKRLRRKNTSAPCLLELRATAIEQQKAARWCVEQGLLSDYGATFGPDTKVTNARIIRAWNSLKKLPVTIK